MCSSLRALAKQLCNIKVYILDKIFANNGFSNVERVCFRFSLRFFKYFGSIFFRKKGTEKIFEIISFDRRPQKVLSKNTIRRGKSQVF
jgi:hypothetical protein